jgi:hypothetical protein
MRMGEHSAAQVHNSADDLFELASAVAEQVGGMATIEAPDDRLLAYSPSDGQADPLRTRVILGLKAPTDAMRRLAELGVVARLRSDPQVIEVPEQPQLGMTTRLAVGIHGETGFLGAIWVQRGVDGFRDGADEVLRQAAFKAARILGGSASAKDLLAQRILTDSDEQTMAEAAKLWRVEPTTPVLVIAVGLREVRRIDEILPLIRPLRTAALAFAADSLVASLAGRLYLLVPGPRTARVRSWAEQLLTKVERQVASGVLHGALARADGLGGIPAARAEADRVLDAAPVAKISDLEGSRTTVLLSELVAALSNDTRFLDPRMARLVDYDDRNNTDLAASLRAYLDAGLNIAKAAQILVVHPNTLRYRLERIQRITGLDMQDPQDRLLTALQLRMSFGPVAPVGFQVQGLVGLD